MASQGDLQSLMAMGFPENRAAKGFLPNPTLKKKKKDRVQRDAVIWSSATSSPLPFPFLLLRLCPFAACMYFLLARQALSKTGYKGVQQAMDWLFAHENDADIDDPVTSSGGHTLAAGDPQTPTDGLCTPGVMQDQLIFLFVRRGTGAGPVAQV